MSLDTFPRVWTWAAESGMPVPVEGEMFREFYSRFGIDEDTIDRCFDGLTERTAECANERMETVIRGRCSQQFEKFLARRLSVVRNPPEGLYLSDGGFG